MAADSKCLAPGNSSLALLLWSRRSRSWTDRLIEGPNDLPIGWVRDDCSGAVSQEVMQIQLDVDGECRIVLYSVLFEEWVEAVGSEAHLVSGEERI
jgi:hypothetical protein